MAWLTKLKKVGKGIKSLFSYCLPKNGNGDPNEVKNSSNVEAVNKTEANKNCDNIEENQILSGKSANYDIEKNQR